MPPKGAAAKRQTSNPASRRQASNPPKAKAAAAPTASVAAPKAAAGSTSTSSRLAASTASSSSAAAAAVTPKASPKASPKVKAAAARAAGTRGTGAAASAASSGATQAASSSAASASTAPAAVPVATEEPENTSTLEASAPQPSAASSSSNQEPDPQQQPQQPQPESEESQVAEKHAEVEGEQATSAAPQASEATQAAVEAELRRLAALANGEVVIKYEMYNEKFPIENHRLKASTIDELYCFSDVMPGCFIHLSDKEYVHGEERTYVKEDPPGTFLGLMAGETYWCVVEQDPEQEKRDQERMRKIWAGGVEGGAIGNRGSEGEGCSCGWGAPCINPMVCKDWDNRFTNAIKAGGNPLLFNTTAS